MTLHLPDARAELCAGVKVTAGLVTKIELEAATIVFDVKDSATWHMAFAELPGLERLRLPVRRAAFPRSLSACRKLTHLELNCGALHVPFPWEALCELAVLEEADLGYNPDVEPSVIPPSLTLLANLRRLGLAQANLTGELPSIEMASLEYLDVGGNRLRGELPDALTAWPLVHLNLDFNEGLCGAIPGGLLEMTGIDLGVHGTSLKGDIVSFQSCSYPMHLLHRDNVLALKEMPTHEDIKDELYTVSMRLPKDFLALYRPKEEAMDKVARCAVVFFSQRWLRPQWHHPDDNEASKWMMIQRILDMHPPCLGYGAIGGGIRSCAACQNSIEYIWDDLLSIPQRSQSHSGRSAVNSLPAYVQHCGKFFVLHGDRGCMTCGRERDPSLDEYMSGGWTRQEALTAQCPVLDKRGSWSAMDTYAANFDSGQVKPLDLGSELVNPLEGKQIPRSMYSRKDRERRLDTCHLLLLPGIEATLKMLKTSPRAEEMQASIVRLSDAVERIQRRTFETAAVEGEPAGTVERGVLEVTCESLSFRSRRPGLPPIALASHKSQIP